VTNLDDAGDVIQMKGSGFFMFMMWKVAFERSKSVQILTIFPLGLEPMPYTSVALVTQYLNVCQLKLGTIIIQTVHILQHDRVDTGSLPERELSMANSNYFPAVVPLHICTNRAIPLKMQYK
jgi:hypothetical protein